MNDNLFSELRLDELGISRAAPLVEWRYFIVLSPMDKEGLSIPVRVEPSKVNLFYRDYPAKDFLVFEVPASSSYRCPCGLSHPIDNLWKTALTSRCNVIAINL